jgi:RNA methyltransferase, TrmH family
MEMEKISSLQNARIKNVVLLQEKSAERKLQNRFVVEGMKELQMALDANYQVEAVFTNDVDAMSEALQSRLQEGGTAMYQTTDDVFAKIAYRENTSKVVALISCKANSLDALALSKNPLIIIVEGVEKPGNIGAIIRTADAIKADAVIVCDAKADLYNPNVIRGSVGTFFAVPLVACTNEDCAAWLAKHDIKAFAAALTATHFYHEVDMREATAIVFGAEATGLTSFWLDKVTQVKIPMLGKNDSLNVSVSVAVMVYEAGRQRNFQ